MKKRLFLTNGASCLSAQVAAVSINDENRVFVNNRAGDPLCTVKHISHDDALAEVANINQQLPPSARRVVLSNGAGCRADLIDTVMVSDDHRILLKARNGALLSSIKCATEEEAAEEIKLINEVLA